MSVSLKRHAKLETVTWHARTGVDGQGKPAYAATGTVLLGRVDRNQDVIRTGKGEEVRIDATVWFTFAASLPKLNDKLVLSGLTGIVVMMNQPADIQSGAIDHLEVMLKRE